MNQSQRPSPPTNLVVLRGAVAQVAAVRDLPSGSVVAQFDLVTSVDIGGRSVANAVPVAWTDPPASELALVGAGAEIVVVGTVRRRFFRVAGATQSRTEVVAETVIPVRRRKQVDSALHAVADGLRPR